MPPEPPILPTRQQAGRPEVDAEPDDVGDAHAEQGGPTRSVGIILRSERVSGKVLQGSYSRENNTVRRIDGPTNIPFEITG